MKQLLVLLIIGSILLSGCIEKDYSASEYNGGQNITCNQYWSYCSDDCVETESMKDTPVGEEYYTCLNNCEIEVMENYEQCEGEYK